MTECNNENINAVKITELEKRMELQTAAAHSAVALAANDLKARLAAMNEFREEMKDAATTYVTRREMELKFEHIEENKKDKTSFWLSLIAIGLTLVLHFIKV